MKREKTRHATQAREVEIPPDTYRPSAAELRETLTKGPAAACRVHVTKSGGSGLPWEQLLAEAPEPEPDEEDGGDDGSGGGGGFGEVEGEARESVPGSPGNLTEVGGDGQVVLSWDAPESDGGRPLTVPESDLQGELAALRGEVACMRAEAERSPDGVAETYR